MKILRFLNENKFLLLLLFTGILFRFYKLDFQSIWIDEIFSMIHADPKSSYLEIYDYIVKNDQHMPLHYFSLHLFFQIFGESTYVARTLSAILGVGGIIAIYYLGKEMMNRNVGLIAAILITVNSFHIFYSQEARMYTMLFLTTTLSFYFLIKYLKQPILKRAIIYALFSALMLYTHIFALFTLFSQYIILLFFVIKPFRIESKKFFLYSLLAGIITLILYIPGIFILIQNSKMASIWIPMPTVDFYTQMFKEFFGNSEMVLYIVFSAILLFFIRLYSREDRSANAIDPVAEKQVFSFFLLSVWIFISLLIPLIISYVNLPMLVTRYFINTLPAVIILVAIGIYYIRNTVVQWVVIAFIVVFSVTDLVIVKDYYNKVTKEQFREVTNEVTALNTENSKLVFYYNWLLPYFFRGQQIAMEASTLENYVSGLRNGKTEKKAFWYIDGHSRPFALSPQDVDFLAQHFVLKEKLEYYDAWANYYVPIDEISAKHELSVKLFRPSKLDVNGNIALYENGALRTRLIDIEKGAYNLIIKGQSLPDKPLDKENAHIIVKMNNAEVANFYLSENPKAQEQHFPISINQGKIRFKLIYDNDKIANGVDRNAIISEIRLVKK